MPVKYFFCLVIIFSQLQLFSQSNVIKTGIFGATAGDFSISYERQTTDRQSVVFKIGHWNISNGLLFTDKIITPDAYTLQKMDGGINTLVEYRFYNSKSMNMSGFFFGPYVRYVHNKALFEDEISNGFYDVNTEVSRYGLGAKVGNQWIINELITIDIFIGLGVDHYNLIRDYTHKSGAFNGYNSIIDDVNDWIYDWNYLKEREKHEVGSDNLLSELAFLFPGIEFGLNLGLSF